MSGLPQVSSKPRIAVQYILDRRKLQTVPKLQPFFNRVRKRIRSMGWDLTEFGPDIDPDAITANAQACKGQHAAFLGITFTGTSARQTAVIGRFEGICGVWFFPGADWWGMASALSGIGYLRDEEMADPNLYAVPIWGDPGSEETIAMLEDFAHSAHTAFAMKREKIGLIGGAYYDVMPASNWHPDTLTRRLGPSYVEVDMSILVRETGKVTLGAVRELIKELKAAGMRVARDKESMKVIEASARVSLAIESIQRKYGLTGAAVNCYGGPDPEAYTGCLGMCGASGCLKGHALGSVVIGCESDVVQTAQQMIFRHLVGTVPCMADPWKLDPESGLMLAGTCSGPAALAARPDMVSIEAGTLMSLYKVGVLGAAFPEIAPADAVVARIAGRDLERMVVSTGRFIKTDSETIPGRLCLHVILDNPRAFLSGAAIGNHYTFLPTLDLERDLRRLEMLCRFMDIEIEYC